MGLLAQKISNPSQYDWNELKRVVRYLKGTSHLKLEMSSKNENDLIGFADANWGENRTDRKSNSGCFFKLNGGTVIWRSKKQTSVALSSTEAEIIALSEATKEALWVKQLSQQIDQSVKLPKAVKNSQKMIRHQIESNT